jgi:conjugal transfer/entry exclusion protein
MDRRAFLSASFLAIAVGSTSAAQAGTIAGFGGATEITQLANFGQLVAQLLEQVAIVAQNVTAQVTRVETLMTQLQQLEQMPATLLNQAVAPWQAQLSYLQNMSSTVGSLQQAAARVSSLYNGASSEASNLGMTGTQYLTAFQNLAQTKGGLYQQQYQQDIQALSDLTTRSQQLQSLAAQAPNISGTVQGLQLLNQQSNIVAAQALEMTSLMRRQATEADNAQADRLQVQSDGAQQLLNNQTESTQSDSAVNSMLSNGTFNILLDSH